MSTDYLPLVENADPARAICIQKGIFHPICRRMENLAARQVDKTEGGGFAPVVFVCVNRSAAGPDLSSEHADEFFNDLFLL